PQVRALDVGEVAGEIRHDCDRQVLHRAGGRAADGCGHPRRPVRRHHDPRRPRALRAAADGAEVARIADLVEAGEQRSLALGELIRVRVLVWLAPGEHALVVARPRLLGDVALELRLDTRPLELAQPRLGLDRTLGRPQLQHLPLPAQHLPHRPPPVDLFAAHRGTSWKPSAASRTIQPAAAISSRRRSASAKSPAARAVRRCSASTTNSGGASSDSASEPRPKSSRPRRSSSWSRHPCRSASASGVLKSSSSAASNAAQSPPGSLGERNTFLKLSTCAFVCASVSSVKSIGLRQCAVMKKSRTTSRPQVSSTLRSETSLPSDFDIFSPAKLSIPFCVQMRANSCPSALDCASSFSWWGKTRSSPPPWISNAGPKASSAIAEHSMCQPGRPRPQGESHDVSSPGLFAFQSAKSRGSFFSGFGSCSSTWSGRWPESRPYCGSRATEK